MPIIGESRSVLVLKALSNQHHHLLVWIQLKPRSYQRPHNPSDLNNQHKPPKTDTMPTYINHKDLLGVIQKLDFEVQHPGGRGCARSGPSDVSSAPGRQP